LASASVKVATTGSVAKPGASASVCPLALSGASVTLTVKDPTWASCPALAKASTETVYVPARGNACDAGGSVLVWGGGRTVSAEPSPQFTSIVSDAALPVVNTSPSENELDSLSTAA
jgi:hypothetical protein